MPTTTESLRYQVAPRVNLTNVSNIKNTVEALTEQMAIIRQLNSEIARKYLESKNVTTNQYLDISKKRFLDHIQKITDLEKNESLWPESGEKPLFEAFFLASNVINELEKAELPPSKIVASADGGITFCFMQGDKYADIECLNSGEILGVTSNRRDRPYVWEIEFSQSDIARAAEQIRDFIR